MSEITEWNDAISYDEFLKSARENVEIMKARYNGLDLSERNLEILAGIQNEIKILVIGRDSCNDTAGNVPVLAKMAAASPKVELRILDSDSNASFHQRFRVNGKRKTPVVLFLSKELNELCRWVERPNAVYKITNEKKNGPDDKRSELRKLYSDPEILHQSLNELIVMLIRSDFLLGRK